MKLLEKNTVLVLLISLLVYSVLYFSNISVYLLNFSYDAFTNLRSPEKKSDKVVIIGIDDAALARYDKNKTGVIPKPVYSSLIDEMAYYSPSVLAFDVIFELKSGSSEETRLLESIGRFNRNVVLSSYFKTEFDFSRPVDVYVEPLETKNAPSNLIYGFVNIFRGINTDHDGVKRKYRPVINDGKTIYNSLPLAMMSVLYDISIPESGAVIEFLEKPSRALHSYIETDGQASYIRYAGSHNNFHIISLADLMDAGAAQKKVYQRLLKDKAVVVGSVSPVHRDYQDVPALSFNLFKRQKQEYGVIILANIADSLLRGSSIKRPSPFKEFAAGYFVTIGPAFIFSCVSPIAGLFVFLAASIAILFLCFVFFVNYGLLLNCFLAITAVFILFAAMSLNKYYLISRESKILMSVLNKYVSPEVARHITRLEIEQSNSGIKKNITVMFADIRGFTAMSENMDPKDISKLLNEYFNKMTAIIFKNGGTIDKFIGDAIMVLFGAPIEIEDAPYKAVKTAMEMMEELKKMRLKWSEKADQTLEIGIGINAGEAFIGNLGTERHKEYSALGDTVNTAARLESQAKKGQILISESVLKSVGDRIKYRRLEPIILRGKSRLQEVFEITGEAGRKE